jgi:sortase A
MNTFSTWTASMLVVAGLITGGNGVWIFGKARVAQGLLEIAWQRDGGKPWPWADTRPLAKLTVEGETVVVLSGASGRTMAFGPGHLDGSALPGEPGNSVITAHRDTHFAALRYVVIGDEISVEQPDGDVIRYEVIATKVVDKTDTRDIGPSSETLLTLVTCYPFDSVIPGGPLRWVVVARAVSGDPSSAASRQHRQSPLPRERERVAGGRVRVS